MTAVSVGAANAKSLRNAGIPADFPPSSFKGKQYVDSNGCVFIRAGISGNVTWVPRVSRSRQQICQQKPTFAKVQKPDVPVVVDVAPSAPKPVTKPAPTQVVTPKPTPKRVVRTPVAKPAPAPKRIVRAPTPKPVAKPTRRVVRRVAQPAVVAAPKPVAVPKPAPKRIVRIAMPSKPPAGYTTVWTDGRHNQNRARGTATGKAQMEMVWTNTVPRRLIAVSTSQDTRRRVVVRLPRKEARQVTIVSTMATPTKRRAVRISSKGSDR